MINTKRSCVASTTPREQQRRVDEQKRVEAEHQRSLLEEQKRRDQQRWDEQERLRVQQLEHQRTAPPRNLSTSNDWSAICSQSVDSGPCNDYQDAFYFDILTGQCYSFIYTGCSGNLNRFGSRNECEQRCSHLMKANQPIVGNRFARTTLTN